MHQPDIPPCPTLFLSDALTLSSSAFAGPDYLAAVVEPLADGVLNDCHELTEREKEGRIASRSRFS